MSRYYFCAVLFVISLFMCGQISKAQEISDSVFLEQAFRDNDKIAVDSMLNSWCGQSISKTRNTLGNDTIDFVYEVYTRFERDYFHKQMAGKSTIPFNGSYAFVQDKIGYLFIDSLSFEDLHYYFGTMFQHYGLLLYRDSIAEYISRVISRRDKIIDPFYPDLKEIFPDLEHDPKPIYIQENNRLNTLVHFLGYRILEKHVISYYTTDIVQLTKRRAFLNNGFHFSDDEFISRFKGGLAPKVLNILMDRRMRYAMVEYANGSDGGTYLAFYPAKLIDSGRGIPLSWCLFME